MRSNSVRAIALLTALLLLAGLLGGCGKENAQATPAQVTPAVKNSASPAPTPDPDPGPPTEIDPPPPGVPAEVLLEEAVGSWEACRLTLYGDVLQPDDAGIWSWLVVRDCGRADFVQAQRSDEMDVSALIERLNRPLVCDESGALLIGEMDYECPTKCEIVRVDGDELELSVYSYDPFDPDEAMIEEEQHYVFRRLQEPGAADGGAAVSDRELRELNERVNTTAENGFFQTTFSRPQEIDWHEALYNGADIDSEPSEAALADFNRYQDEDWDCPIVCIESSALRTFVWEKTLTSYDVAEKQLWTNWYESDGCFLTSHGDTNFMPITLTSATADGEIYRLYYERTDYANSVWEPVPFVMTLRVRGGEWQYISNLRADAPCLTLLTVDYFDEEEGVPDFLNVTEFVETPALPSDEPSWKWAVLTAREDGVRYCVDRTDFSYDEADYFLVMYLDRYIGDNITSGVLDKGERVAVKVNTPWYPTIRVTATKDTLWGELWFGENGMLHIFDTAARSYVVGRDADAEGRGCDPDTENELMAFLRDGDWFYLDPETYEPLAVMRFPYGHSCDIEWSEGFYEFNVWYAYEDEHRGGAPDTIGFFRGYDDYTDWSVLPERLQTEDKLGSYTWQAFQLDGEQILYLTQLEVQPGPLSYLLPGATEDTIEFLFVRFNGTTLEEAQG